MHNTNVNQFQAYHKLIKNLGRQNWWPADSPFEVIIGAVLTQQSTWRNVEKAIINLKSESLLTSKAIAETDLNKLEKCVRPTGFYRQKARRLREFARYIEKNYKGDLDLLFSKPLAEVREELLSLDGVGPETADSILLYAGGMLVFPVDAYTKRVYGRLGLKENSYEELQNFFHHNLPQNLEIYREMHALIVELAKRYCSSSRTLCEECPLRSDCRFSKKL